MPPVTVGLAGQGFRPKSPGGYRFVGRYFQAFPPVGATWPEGLVRYLRRLDPELCPMWCNNVYRSEAGATIMIGRHWLWRAIRDQRVHTITPRFIPASRGPNQGRKPNTMLLALEKDRTEQQIEEGVAGDPLPFGWWLYDLLHAARAAYEPDYDKEADTRDEAWVDRRFENAKAIQDRVAERFDSSEWRDFKKACHALTEADLEQIQKHGLFGIAQQRTAKPTVDLGGRAA